MFPCTVLRGGVSERPKERASKAREVQASKGSNPFATATTMAPDVLTVDQFGSDRRFATTAACTPSGGRPGAGTVPGASPRARAPGALARSMPAAA